MLVVANDYLCCSYARSFLFYLLFPVLLSYITTGQNIKVQAGSYIATYEGRWMWAEAGAYFGTAALRSTVRLGRPVSPSWGVISLTAKLDLLLLLTEAVGHGEERIE